MALRDNLEDPAPNRAQLSEGQPKLYTQARADPETTGGGESEGTGAVNLEPPSGREIDPSDRGGPKRARRQAVAIPLGEYDSGEDASPNRRGVWREDGAPQAAAATLAARPAQGMGHEFVPQIWKMLAEGMSKEAVVKEMNRLGVPSPRRRRWHLNSVDRVLALTSDATPPNPEATLAIKLGSKKFRRLRRARVFAPTIASLRVSGWTYDAIAAEFQRIGVPMTRRGAWRGSTVWKLHRLASNETGGHA